MTGSNFVFPPPPPPPPVATQSSFSPQSQSHNGWRGGHGNRWSSRGRGRGGSFRGGGLQNPQISHRQFDTNGYGQSSLNTTHKRQYAEAFSSGKKAAPRTAVAPAVPSFGSPIPLPTAVTPPYARSGVNKRKTNQLGLTPAPQNHDSSSEDDANEEERLGESLKAPGNTEFYVSTVCIKIVLIACRLQFSYKGQLSSLNSPAEIAAWIEERKKRYPTKARVEEAIARKTKEREDMKVKKTQGSRNSRKTRCEAADRPRRKGSTSYESGQSKTTLHKKADDIHKDQDAKCQAGIQDETTKARLKALKLQKKLEKAQKQLAAIEAKGTALQQGRPQKDTTQGVYKSIINGNLDTERSLPEAQLNEMQSIETPMPSIPSTLEQPNLDEKATDNESVLSSECDSHTSSELTDIGSDGSEDETSSSGSSDSDADSAPLEISSKSNLPELVPRISEPKAKAICKYFRTKGHCRNGKNCRFLHPVPDKTGISSRGRDKQNKSSSRSSLYQRLLARQQEEEDEKVLRYIVQLGQSGLLDEPDPTGNDEKLNTFTS